MENTDKNNPAAKNHKNVFIYVSESIKALLNVIMAVLCLVKIEHDVAVLPDIEDGTGKIDYYYSVYDKLAGKNLQFIVYIALAVMAASVAFSVVACVFKDNRKIRIAGHAVFAVSALFFIVLLVYSAQFLRYMY